MMKHLDLAFAVAAFITVIFIAALLWMTGALREVLLVSVSPILTTIGVFIAHRLNEKAKNPKLRIVGWGIHRRDKHSARLFVEVENKAGREVARDARATITIKKIINKEREVDLEPADLATDKGELVEFDDPLVSELNPRIEGEPLPWMIPEMPYHSRGLHDIELKHIANIGPGQKNRATILEVIHLREESLSGGNTYYYLRIFAEYGTETAVISVKLPSKGEKLEQLTLRRVRCVLKPGIYRIRLQVSADKAHPVTGLIEVDTKIGEIRCLDPSRVIFNLKNLEPVSKSTLPPSGRSLTDKLKFFSLI
jgi:hypothetical protein